MKQSTKNQIQGTLHEIKGSLKQEAGQATNNPQLAGEGQAESIAAKVQQKVAQIQRVFEK